MAGFRSTGTPIGRLLAFFSDISSICPFSKKTVNTACLQDHELGGLLAPWPGRSDLIRDVAEPADPSSDGSGLLRSVSEWQELAASGGSALTRLGTLNKAGARAQAARAVLHPGSGGERHP